VPALSLLLPWTLLLLLKSSLPGFVVYFTFIGVESLIDFALVLSAHIVEFFATSIVTPAGVEVSVVAKKTVIYLCSRRRLADVCAGGYFGDT
jgi:hypothetical protein